MNVEKSLYWLLSAVALCCLAVFCIFPVRSNDVFIYLEIGRRFFAPEGLPRTDVFLFTGANTRFDYYHELGSIILFYVVYAAGGFTALIFAKTGIFVAMGSLPLWVARKLDVSRQTLLLPLLMFLAFYGSAGRLIERGSIFSDLFSTLLLGLVVVIRAKKGNVGLYRKIIPVVFLLWVNCHAGFVVGIAILLAWLLAEAFEHGVGGAGTAAARLREVAPVLWTIGASLALGLVNPRGVYAYLLPLRMIGDTSLEVYKRYNTEYLPPWAKEYRYIPDMQVFLVLLLAGLLILAVSVGRTLSTKKYRELPVFEIASFGLLAFLGLSMVRFVNTAAFGTAVLAASLLVKGDLTMREPASGAPGWRRWLFPSAALGAMVLLFVADVAYGRGPSRGKRKFGLGIDLTEKPEKACAFIDANRVGVNIFNQYEFGAYMIWRWQGKVKVFSHGFLGDTEYFVRDYIGINRSAAEFDRIVGTYDIRAFLVKTVILTANTGPNYYRKLLSSPEWHLVYMDRVAMLFVKDVPENRGVIEKYSTRARR